MIENFRTTTDIIKGAKTPEERKALLPDVFKEKVDVVSVGVSENLNRNDHDINIDDLNDGLRLLKLRRELGNISSEDEERTLKDLLGKVDILIKPLEKIKQEINGELILNFDKTKKTSSEGNDNIDRKKEIIRVLNEMKFGLVDYGRRMKVIFDERSDQNLDLLIEPEMMDTIWLGINQVENSIGVDHFNTDDFENGLDKINSGFENMLTTVGDGDDDPENLFLLKSTVTNFRETLNEMAKKLSSSPEYEAIQFKLSGCLDLIDHRIDLLKNRYNIVVEYQSGLRR